MKEQVKPRKKEMSPKERFRASCPEMYERMLAEKVKELPHDKQVLFFRLAMRYNESHVYI